MHQVDDFVAKEVVNKGGRFSIGRLGLECPSCRRNVWFAFGANPLGVNDVRQGPRKMPCPGCDEAIYFYVLSTVSKSSSGWLWLHPSPTTHLRRDDVAAALEQIAPALRQAYDDAVAVLADRRASAATTEARRMLEGLVKHLLVGAGYELPERPVLAQLIEQLAQKINLAQPLTDTAHAVRDGGNLGAHYDADRVASPELAFEAVQLVEAIVDYLVLLPQRVKRLRDMMDAAPASDAIPSPVEP